MRDDKIQKTQAVRLADVFAIGPLMIYAATKTEDLPMWVRVALGLCGAGTIAYNGVNYLEQKEQLETLDLDNMLVEIEE